MKKLTTDQSKIDLVAKLVKDGVIDFVDAIKLLEVEVEKEYITVPYRDSHLDWIQPYNPPYWPMPTFCDTKVATTTNLIAYSN